MSSIQRPRRSGRGEHTRFSPSPSIPSRRPAPEDAPEPELPLPRRSRTVQEDLSPPPAAPPVDLSPIPQTKVAVRTQGKLNPVSVIDFEIAQVWDMARVQLRELGFQALRLSEDDAILFTWTYDMKLGPTRSKEGEVNLATESDWNQLQSRCGSIRGARKYVELFLIGTQKGASSDSSAPPSSQQGRRTVNAQMVAQLPTDTATHREMIMRLKDTYFCLQCDRQCFVRNGKHMRLMEEDIAAWAAGMVGGTPIATLHNPPRGSRFDKYFNADNPGAETPRTNNSSPSPFTFMPQSPGLPYPYPMLPPMWPMAPMMQHTVQRQPSPADPRSSPPIEEDAEGSLLRDFLEYVKEKSEARAFCVEEHFNRLTEADYDVKMLKHLSWEGAKSMGITRGNYDRLLHCRRKWKPSSE
ncbi:hypothetical protein SAICODRAFT_7954 [Saitoella complicata NRRL Y-17804]|uniref:uncharacterized protein n=1 Tax=Saitoella complicata (strain BCRC 22490 / CBS 7301 / JCM 7358 / NBRC 10748 / NRRL Y-17804) TaxID=698492 RepID=UPI0008679FBA|nr:uncharacterized protein SAICODRAFT_7954 [Saitoella complicata NRRL Y-17804]ODQ52528.1 hypothetical protein SAICODRAFT_7954 [Saitoella complicata NRRL Y-17804]